MLQKKAEIFKNKSKYFVLTRSVKCKRIEEYYRHITRITQTYLVMYKYNGIVCICRVDNC